MTMIKSHDTGHTCPCVR